jgi:hypothetical protein
VKAGQRFPALNWSIPVPGLENPVPVKLVGSQDWVWRTPKAVEILQFTWKKKLENRFLCRELFEPLLFFLALRAGTEGAGDAPSSRQWVEGRALAIHLVHGQGIASFTWAAEDFPAAEAIPYLMALTGALLDRRACDFLPLEILVGDKDYYPIFSGDEAEAEAIRPGFDKRLQDACDRDAQDRYSDYRWNRLPAIFQPKVPADAFDKLRRRLPFLDAGLARTRKPKRKGK